MTPKDIIEKSGGEERPHEPSDEVENLVEEIIGDVDDSNIDELFERIDHLEEMIKDLAKRQKRYQKLFRTSASMTMLTITAAICSIWAVAPMPARAFIADRAGKSVAVAAEAIRDFREPEAIIEENDSQSDHDGNAKLPKTE